MMQDSQDTQGAFDHAPGPNGAPGRGGRASGAEPLSLIDMLAIIRAQALEDDRLTVDELLDAFGERAFGPLLFAPAFIAVAPIIGMLPGVSLTMAALMTLFSLQLALGLRRPWAPAPLRRASLPGGAVVRALDAVGPTARLICRVFKPRLQFLARRPWVHLTGLIALLAALLTCIGALVPGLIVPPAVVIILVALALAAQDGATLLIAYALTAGVTAMVVWAATRLGVL